MRIVATCCSIGLITIFALSAAAQKSAGSTLNLYDLDITFTRPADSTQVHSKTVFKHAKEPVVLVFWLTTCQPCMREMDAYAREYASWKKQAKFRMVAVSIDFPNRFKRIHAIVKEKGLPFDAVWDSRRSFKDVLPGALNGLPQVFLFNPAGGLVWHHKGFTPGDEAELFRQILANQAK